MSFLFQQTEFTIKRVNSQSSHKWAFLDRQLTTGLSGTRYALQYSFSIKPIKVSLVPHFINYFLRNRKAPTVITWQGNSIYVKSELHTVTKLIHHKELQAIRDDSSHVQKFDSDTYWVSHQCEKIWKDLFANTLPSRWNELHGVLKKPWSLFENQEQAMFCV